MEGAELEEAETEEEGKEAEEEEEEELEEDLEDENEEEEEEKPGKKKCQECYKFRGFRFLCSYRHLPSSLDSLVESLKSKCRPLDCPACTTDQVCPDCLPKERAADVFKHTFKYVEQHFGAEHLPLLLRKGVFPYSYIRSLEQLQETQLPPAECFYNELTESPVKPAEYAHAQNVFKTLNMPNLLAYQETYLITDTTLLADVLVNYRKLLYQEDGIDFTRFVSLPSIAYQSMLKKTGVRLELISDPIIHQMLTLGKRGGLTIVGQRYGKSTEVPFPFDDQSNDIQQPPDQPTMPEVMREDKMRIPPDQRKTYIKYLVNIHFSLHDMFFFLLFLNKLS